MVEQIMSTSKMAARCCCSCNKKSSCLRCSCVKKGSSCSNCVPFSLDKCKNQAKKQVTMASSGVSSTVSNQHHHNVASITSVSLTL